MRCFCCSRLMQIEWNRSLQVVMHAVIQFYWSQVCGLIAVWELSSLSGSVSLRVDGAVARYRIRWLSVRRGTLVAHWPTLQQLAVAFAVSRCLSSKCRCQGGYYYRCRRLCWRCGLWLPSLFTCAQNTRVCPPTVEDASPSSGKCGWTQPRDGAIHGATPDSAASLSAGSHLPSQQTYLSTLVRYRLSWKLF